MVTTKEWITVREASRLYGKAYNTILREIWMGRLVHRMGTNEKKVPAYQIELESLHALARKKGWVLARRGAA